METLASVIRARRKERKFTIVKPAEKIGVHHSYITYIENRTRLPSLEVLLKLEEVLGVDCQTPFFRERHPTLEGYRLVYGRKGKGKSKVKRRLKFKLYPTK